VFDSLETLPDNLRFLGKLDHRFLEFRDQNYPEFTQVYANALTVPEPSLAPLLAFGLSLACVARRRRGFLPT